MLAAGTPEQALRLVREHTGAIHVLITDVVMPAMNGQDLALQVAAIRLETRCLFMSGHTAEIIAQRGMIDADVQFIGKPFTMHDMAAKVREVLSRKESVSIVACG